MFGPTSLPSRNRVLTAIQHITQNIETVRPGWVSSDGVTGLFIFVTVLISTAGD